MMHPFHAYPTPPRSPTRDTDDTTEAFPVVIASTRTVIAGKLTPGTIVISRESGKIVEVYDSVLPQSHFPSEWHYNDYSPSFILPGLVDAHVHLNEPGRTEWEGFYSGTRAAAAGGVTTVVDMPLNAIPPTTTVAGLREKVRAAQGKCWVDVGFYGGIIPGNAKELKALVREGVRGFKAFLIDSGVEEFPAVGVNDIVRAFEELADEPTVVMFHAEMLPNTTASEAANFHSPSPSAVFAGAVDDYMTFLNSRPPSLETCAIETVLALSHIAPDLPLHIVHLSAGEAIPILRAARASGVKITAETCPHYLSLAAEEIQRGDTRYKCCPPIRMSSNQDKLWEELLRHQEDGVITTVVSDHSPCTPDIKLLPLQIPSRRKQRVQRNTQPVKDKDLGNFLTAWGGVSSVGLGLPILWTEMTRRGLVTPAKVEVAITSVVKWCCLNTSFQVGLQDRKGDIGVGLDADFCIFDAEAQWVVKPTTMLFRNKCSPYEGMTMVGKVKESWLRGRKVYRHGAENDGFGDAKCAGSPILQARR